MYDESYTVRAKAQYKTKIMWAATARTGAATAALVLIAAASSEGSEVWNDRVVSAMPMPRSQFGVATMQNGDVIVSGTDARGNTTSIWTPATNAWRAGPEMHYSRGDHAMTTLADGRIMAAGGECGSPCESDTRPSLRRPAAGLLLPPQTHSSPTDLCRRTMLFLFAQYKSEEGASASPILRPDALGHHGTLAALGLMMTPASLRLLFFLFWADTIADLSRTVEILDPATMLWTMVANMTAYRCVRHNTPARQAHVDLFCGEEEGREPSVACRDPVWAAEVVRARCLCVCV